MAGSMTAVFFGFGFLLTGVNFFSGAEVEARESFRKRGREPGLTEIGLGFGPIGELSIAVFIQRFVSLIAMAAGFYVLLLQAHTPGAVMIVLAVGLAAIVAKVILAASAESRARVAGVTKWAANLAIFGALALMVFNSRNGK